MPDPFRYLQPGDNFPTSVRTWNAMIEAGKLAAADRFGSRFDPLSTTRSSALVRVLNDTGAGLDRCSVVGLDGPVFTPTDSEDAFLREVAFRGVTPTVADHSGKFAVLLEPIAPDTIGRAWVAGVCPVMVDVIDEAHGYADVTDGDGTKLTSSHIGTAQILWFEGGEVYGPYDTGEQWAIVRLGCRPGDVAIGQVTSTISKATSATRPGIGKVKLYTSVDMTTSPPTYGSLTADEYDCLSFNLDNAIDVGANVPLNRILGQWHAINVDSCDNLTP